MTPKLRGIDHVHVYVSSWHAAEEWYQKVLGFTRVEALMVWAVKDGPLTLENPEGSVHLALFESDRAPTSTIAFGASGEKFLAWKAHLENHSIELRVVNHQLAWSMYFSDSFGNYHEITTYDCDIVSKQFA